MNPRYKHNDILFNINDNKRVKYFGFIYKRTNLKNGKIYIGKRKFTKNYERDRKYSGSGTLLKKDFNKYSIKNFTKEILEYCKTKNRLSIREHYWAVVNNSYFPNGYNISKCGSGGVDNFTNNPDKENIRKRISDAINNSEKFKIFIRTFMKGVPKTKKSNIKRSYSLRNSKKFKLAMLSESRSAKLRKAFKDIPLTKKHRNNLSKALKDKPKNKNYYCIHCKKYFDGGNYILWHGDHCYKNPLINKKVESKRRSLMMKKK